MIMYVVDKIVSLSFSQGISAGDKNSLGAVTRKRLEDKQLEIAKEALDRLRKDMHKEV